MITVTQQELVRLDSPKPCGITVCRDDAIIFCGKAANWSVDDVPVCFHDIQVMSGMNSDNEQFFEQALAEERAIRFAPILKQVAAEMGLEVLYPDDPKRIFALFPATKSWEELESLHKRAGERIRELQEAQA